MPDEKSRIIVADTSSRIREILKNKFTNAGLPVEDFDNIKDVVISATLDTPRAIIFDTSILNSSGGEKLLEMLDAIPGKEAIPVIFISSSFNVSITGPGTRQIAVIKKPYLFEELLKKLTAVIDNEHAGKKKQGTKTKKKKGLELVEIIQVLASSRKSCVIELKKGYEPDAKAGQIVLKSGKIIDAVIGENAGEEVFYELFAWAGADFFIIENKKDAHQTIDTDMNSLMLEGMRRMDSEN